MKVRKKCLMILLSMFCVLLMLACNGCKESEEPTVTAPKAGQATAGTIELCTMCGQIKGSEMCCKPGQEKCAGCGLTKDSIGCCKIPKDAQTAAICTKCGQMAGSESCCKPDQPKCEKCGLVKGSPGCCKLPAI